MSYRLRYMFVWKRKFRVALIPKVSYSNLNRYKFKQNLLAGTF